jgi:hypothetical protein
MDPSDFKVIIKSSAEVKVNPNRKSVAGLHLKF